MKTPVKRALHQQQPSPIGSPSKKSYEEKIRKYRILKLNISYTMHPFHIYSFESLIRIPY